VDPDSLSGVEEVWEGEGQGPVLDWAEFEGLTPPATHLPLSLPPVAVVLEGDLVDLPPGRLHLFNPYLLGADSSSEEEEEEEEEKTTEDEKVGVK